GPWVRSGSTIESSRMASGPTTGWRPGWSSHIASIQKKGRHMIDFGLGKLRLWSAAAASAGLFMTQAAGAHPAAFTLNDVMQAPFAWDMLAAPKGAAVAWVFSVKGCSNIWVADPSHGAKARQI